MRFGQATGVKHLLGGPHGGREVCVDVVRRCSVAGGERIVGASVVVRRISLGVRSGRGGRIAVGVTIGNWISVGRRMRIVGQAVLRLLRDSRRMVWGVGFGGRISLIGRGGRFFREWLPAIGWRKPEYRTAFGSLGSTEGRWL